MSNMNDFVSRTRAQQDQRTAANQKWIDSIPAFVESVNDELEQLPDQINVVVKTVDCDKLRLKFGDRPIGYGGPFADHVQTGAAIVFFFENETRTVWSERTLFERAGYPSLTEREDHGNPSKESFENTLIDTIVNFVEWATIGKGCGGHMPRL